MADAIVRLLNMRKEEPAEENRYVREALTRAEYNLEQVSPNVWFQAPAGWKAGSFVEKVFQGLTGGENANHNGDSDFGRSDGDSASERRAFA